MEQSKIERSITLYTAAWNLEGVDDIKFALNAFWTDDTTYMDAQTPLLTGIDAMAALIQQSYTVLPGRKFRQLTHPEVHNNTGRFGWLLVREDETTAEGMDFFEFNNDGYITRIIGFSASPQPFEK